MKNYRKKGILQKIIIAFMTFILLFQFMLPVKSEALFDDFKIPTWDEIFSSMAQVLAAGGDLVMGALNNFMLGTKGFGTAMISNEALGKGSWFDPVDDDGNTITASPTGTIDEGSTEGEATEESSDGIDEIKIGKDSSGKNIVVYVEDGTITEGAVLAGSENWEVPNLLYCPENIFGNNIAMLDVNFLNPNTYDPVITKGRGVDSAKEKKDSIAGELKNTIASWYKAFRNIAVVALLSILVYLGIRILLSSTAEDKAKYKETIKDWLIALVLVFAMHYIMSFTIMIVNQINSLFVEFNNSIYVSYDGQLFRSNLTGVIRFLAQSQDGFNAWAYTIIYIILVVYTITFTIQYLKRVLYIAFYTMISPLVAITYPIDKLGDGKSQAFNKWLKEYVMTMTLQPIHLIIYSMIVSSALSLSIKSPIYAIVAIGFLIPAEQFIKSLFGVESKADGGFGSVATAALAMSALNSMKKPIGLHKGKSGNSGNSGNSSNGSDNSNEEKPKIRQSSNKELESFNKDGNNETRENINGESDGQYGIDNVNSENHEMMDNDSLNMANNDDGNTRSRTAQFISDTYNNTEFAKQRRINKAFRDANNQIKADEKAEKLQKKQKEKQEEAEAKRRLKNINAQKKQKEAEERRRQFAKNHPNISKGARFTRNLAGAVAGDAGNAIRRAAEKRAANAPKRAIKKAINKKYRGRLYKAAGFPSAKAIGKGVLNAGKFVARNGLRAAGGVIGAGAGLAIGVASGKGLEGAAKGLGAGVAAGAALGNSAYNLGEGVVSGAVGVVGSEINQRKSVHDIKREREIDRLEATEGVEAANKYAREHISRADRKRYNELLNDYTIKTGQNLEDVKDKSELYKDIYDYESHGVADKDKIIKGLQLEHDDKYRELRRDTGLENSSSKHDNIVDVMNYTNSFGKQYITDKKKSEEFERTLDLGLQRDSDKDKVRQLFYAANGYDHKEAVGGRTTSDSSTGSRQTSNTQTASRGSTRGRRRSTPPTPPTPPPSNPNTNNS